MPSITGNQSNSVSLVTAQENPINALQIALEDPDGNPEAGAVTLAFAINPPSNNVYLTEAIVSWSISGNRITRRFSIGNGATITGVAEAVNVQVVDHTGDLSSGFIAGESYGVTISAGLGTRGSVSELPTLQEVDNMGQNLAAATAVDVTIPQDAGVTGYRVLFSSGAVFNAIEAAVECYIPGTFYRAPKNVIDGDTGEIPITPGTTAVRIINYDAANNVIWSLIWLIDG